MFFTAIAFFQLFDLLFQLLQNDSHLVGAFVQGSFLLAAIRITLIPIINIYIDVNVFFTRHDYFCAVFFDSWR